MLVNGRRRVEGDGKRPWKGWGLKVGAREVLLRPAWRVQAQVPEAEFDEGGGCGARSDAVL